MRAQPAGPVRDGLRRRARHVPPGSGPGPNVTVRTFPGKGRAFAGSPEPAKVVTAYTRNITQDS